MPESRSKKRHAELLALGTKIREQRHVAGFSQRELAERSGISKRMVVGIEAGTRNASVAALLDLAEALGVRPGQLLDVAPVDQDDDL